MSIATVADMIAAQAHADGWLLGTQASSWTVGDLPNQMRSGTQIWWLPYPADPGVVVTGVRACFTRGTDILTLIISGGHIDTLNGDRYVAGIDVATGPAHTFTWNCR